MANACRDGKPMLVVVLANDHLIESTYHDYEPLLNLLNGTRKVHMDVATKSMLVLIGKTVCYKK